MKRIVAGIATVSALAIGGVAAAGALGPVSGDSATEADAPRERGHHGPRGRLLRGALDTAAEAIGISREELVAALRDGQSIAEVAEANGVTADAVADAIVETVNEKIDEWQETRLADLVERLVRRDPGETPS